MYTLIDSHEDLMFLNQELINRPYVAVDTEFRRTHKDNMRLALLQVNDDEETFLIDSILIKDPGDSVSFLFSDSVTKIFHSCKEDLEAIYSWTQSEMVNIFDTQLAHSFLDNGYSISYQALVEEKLGITLDKKETRSNWIRRPLSEAQLKYASLDVEYLIPLYLEQNMRLKNSKRLDWLNEEIDRLIQSTFNPETYLFDVERVLTKSQERNLLEKMNEIILDISEKEEVNPTLFFSKKAQKDFLRIALDKGINFACSQITAWRRELIEEDLLELLR